MEDCRRHQLREQAIERPKMPKLTKLSVATGQLLAADGMIQSPSVTTGAVEHFAVIGKMARLGTINRATVEPIAAGRRRGAAHDQLTPVLRASMSLARLGTPTQVIPSRLQRADASFEFAPNTAMIIAGMYIAILNNTVHLVQVS